MKIFQKFGFSLAFILAFAVLAIAQIEKAESSTPAKIAVVDMEVLKDKEKGIKELAEAYAKLDEEFKSLNDELKFLYEKYNKLINELKAMADVEPPKNLTKQIIDDKIKELRLLEKDVKKKQEDGKIIYAKRRAEVVGIVENKIIKSVNQFAEEKNYVITFDVSILNESFILTKPEITDVTDEFIKYYKSLPTEQQ